MARAVKKVREREEEEVAKKKTPLYTYIDPFDLVESPPLSSISKAIYYTYIKKWAPIEEEEWMTPPSSTKNSQKRYVMT